MCAAHKSHVVHGIPHTLHLVFHCLTVKFLTLVMASVTLELQFSVLLELQFKVNLELQGSVLLELHFKVNLELQFSARCWSSSSSLLLERKAREGGGWGRGGGCTIYLGITRADFGTCDPRYLGNSDLTTSVRCKANSCVQWNPKYRWKWPKSEVLTIQGNEG